MNSFRPAVRTIVILVGNAILKHGTPNRIAGPSTTQTSGPTSFIVSSGGYVTAGVARLSIVLVGLKVPHYAERRRGWNGASPYLLRDNSFCHSMT
jgi:hypothetical protein